MQPKRLMRITDVRTHCPNCGWEGKVMDAEPDIDGDGGLGCPTCGAVVITDGDGIGANHSDLESNKREAQP